jgi:uncharacterized protein YybS (DUF2232 family)
VQALANYILRGRLQAALVIALAALLSMTGILFPLSLISGAALALVTLRLGAVHGLMVVAYSTLAFIAISLGLFNDLRLVWEVLLTFWLPVLILAELLRRTVSLPITIGVGGGVTVLYIALVYLVAGDPAPAWTAQLTQIFEALVGIEQTKSAEIQEFIARLAPMMTGGQAMSVLGFAIFSLFIARWWQAKLYNPGGFRQEFHSFRLGRWFAWPALVVLLGMSLALYGNGGLLAQMSLEMSMVVLSLYLLQGMAVVHGVVGLTKANVGWLVAFYVLLMVPQVLVLVVITGLFDSWLDIRARLAQARD